MFENYPILQAADLRGNEQLLSEQNDAPRQLQQFTGRFGNPTSPEAAGALASMSDAERRNAVMKMRARLGELSARQNLHDQKLAMFYKQLAFQELQRKWARRDENAAMIGAGVGALGQIGGGALGGLFKDTPTYNPSEDPSLDQLYSNSNSNLPLNYEPVPDWFVRQRMNGSTLLSQR